VSNLTVLVVVAHSDDETIGMGGTICRHVSRGDRVFVVSMTDGVGGRTGTVTDDVEKRKKSAKRASEILGFEWAEAYSFVDNAMDRVSLLEVVKCVEAVKSSLQPALIYTHSGADLNIDHRVVANAVLTAFRPQPNESWTEIRAFEVASATDYGHESTTNSFNPNVFIDVTSEWPKKQEALTAYCAEMRDYPHSRSMEGIENLARYRGNQVGLMMAEAFQVIRRIERRR